MGLIEIDGAEALRLLAEAVEAKGADYVYPRADYGCAYVRDGVPSCLVAHALYRAGLGIDTLKAIDRGDFIGADGSDGESSINVVCGVSAELFGFSADREAQVAFDRAQSAQDFGKTWGEALEAAKKAVGV